MVFGHGLGLTAAEVDAVTLDKLTGETIRRVQDRFACRKVGTLLYLVNRFGGWWKLKLQNGAFIRPVIGPQVANSNWYMPLDRNARMDEQRIQDAARS
jgi:hypothetical protein